MTEFEGATQEMLAVGYERVIWVEGELYNLSEAVVAGAVVKSCFASGGVERITIKDKYWI